MSEITFVGDSFESPILHLGMYSDATTFVKTDEFATICERADTMILRPSTISDFIAGLSMVDAVRSFSPRNRIDNLILPYIPGARQDRVNPTGDVGFMLGTVARILNSYNFDRVLVVDPHSEASFVKIHNIDVYPYQFMYEHLPRDYSGVISPDKGAVNRATQAFYALDMDHTTQNLVQASKIRDVSTGRLSGFSVHTKPGDHYLVVDDICDGGGTFIGLGEKILEQGATADLFVSHGIFAKGTDELKKYYRTIYTTNTRDIHERNDVVVFDIMKELRNYK